MGHLLGKIVSTQPAIKLRLQGRKITRVINDDIGEIAKFSVGWLKSISALKVIHGHPANNGPLTAKITRHIYSHDLICKRKRIAEGARSRNLNN